MANKLGTATAQLAIKQRGGEAGLSSATYGVSEACMTIVGAPRREDREV